MQTKKPHIRDSVIPEESIALKPITLSLEENGVIYSRYGIEYCETATLRIDYDNLGDFVPINMRKYMLFKQLRAS